MTEIAAAPLNRRLAWIHAIVGLALALLGVLVFDVPVAELVRATGVEGARVFAVGTTVLDLLTGKDLSKFLLGGVVVLAGAALASQAKTRAAGRLALYVGNVQVFATLITGVAKNAFGRLRPFELLVDPRPDATWFVDGSSFPSGHAGFYFGLCLPLACAFPRLRWPLLAVAWFIAVARVVANDHFVADVGASIAVAAVLTWVLAPIAGRPASAVDTAALAPPRA